MHEELFVRTLVKAWVNWKQQLQYEVYDSFSIFQVSNQVSLNHRIFSRKSNWPGDILVFSLAEQVLGNLNLALVKLELL